MAEIVPGKIVSVDAHGLTVRVPYTDMQRFVHRQYDEVRVELADGRSRTPEQLRKAWAIMSDIALWQTGDKRDAREGVYRPLAAQFSADVQQSLSKQLFHLSTADVTTAREFINFLIDICLEYDIPMSQPLGELSDDIDRYVYACALHKKCAVCGHKAEIHHVDIIGMGGDREHMDHRGMRALPLCRKHHREAHDNGTEAMMAAWHLVPLVIDDEIARIYKLGERSNEQIVSDRQPGEGP